MSEPRPEYELFTDGACSGNPGPGGWGYILRPREAGEEVQASGGEPQTTNNRMELTSVIEGLRVLDAASRVRVITDSSYVAKGIREWMPNWKAQGWKRREGRKFKPVKNVDLWQALDELLGVHDVETVQVAGHAGHPENEACDRLAVAAYQQYL